MDDTAKLTKNSDLLDYQFKIDSLKFLLREALSCLTNGEFKVLCFIYDRTIGWNKMSEHIALTHFIEGVHNKETGKTYSLGAGFKRRSVFYILKSLVKKKILIKLAKNNYGVPRYSINFDWKGEGIEKFDDNNDDDDNGNDDDDDEDEDDEDDILREPKQNKLKKKEVQEFAQRGAKNYTQRVQQLAPKETKRERNGNRQGADLTVSMVAAKEKSVRERKKNLNISDMTMMWSDSFRKAFNDEATKYDDLNNRMLRRNLRLWRDEWKEEDGSDYNFEKFFDYVCENWNTLCNVRFGKWKECPRIPTLTLIHTFRRKLFVSQYSIDYYKSLEARHDKLEKFKNLALIEIKNKDALLKGKYSRLVSNSTKLEELIEKAEEMGLGKKVKAMISDEELKALLEDEKEWEFKDFDSLLKEAEKL